MKADYILIRFGELTTKGKNRKVFTQKLLKNTKEILKEYKQLAYDLKHDRMYIVLNDVDANIVCNHLKIVFGIHSFSICYKVEKELPIIKDVVVKLINDSTFKTFKIKTKRSDKLFPGSSNEINREIAGHVFHNVSRDLKVDVHEPEILITVEIRHDACYIMDNVIMGAGGYPVGVGGKSLLMLSGGIDSPVAGFLTLKRGVDIECIHFASPPYTNQQARDKMLDLVHEMKNFGQGRIVVHIVDFTKLQLAVYDHASESYAMTVMRRMMYRISEKVAKNKKCLAIVNGESIGQVASQTLHSMQAINEVTSMPVLRPVLCLDKLEIIEIAKKINTYDISIRPHEDCCTIFTPKSPATKPRNYIAKEYEDAFDYETLVNECVDGIETIVIDSSYGKNEDLF